MTGQTPSRPRFAKASTPAIVFGSLALALGLTTVQDTTAQAQKGEPRAAGRAAQGYDATDLRILDWTLWYVAKYYVEPERIDPHKMAIAGLEGLEKAIPKEFMLHAHHWLILHGRYTCKAVRPACETCVIADLCVSTDKRI